MLGEESQKSLNLRPGSLLVLIACLICLSASAAFLVAYAVYKKQSDDKDRQVIAVERNNQFLSDRNIELQNSLQKLGDAYGNLETRYKDLAASLVLAHHATAARTGNSLPGLPPIEQPLVREGKFAVNLATAFNLTSSQDETVAESYLASINIMPRNGWISDYPVTPDIIAEIRKSAATSASSGYLQISEADAVELVDNISVAMNLPIANNDPASENRSRSASVSSDSSGYVEPSAVEDYYDDNKPAIVTYYPPPLEYAYLYDWVPSPFWWEGFGFRGFFILIDFERRHHHHLITNHVTSANGKVSKINAITRASAVANPQTGAGVGASNKADPKVSPVLASPGAAFDTGRAVQRPAGRAPDIEKSASRPRASLKADFRSSRYEGRTLNGTPSPRFPAGGGYSGGTGDSRRADTGMKAQSGGLGSGKVRKNLNIPGFSPKRRFSKPLIQKCRSGRQILP